MFRRQTDDEIYRHHARWLGEGPWQFARGIPYRAVLPALVVFPVSLLFLSAFGASGLWLIAVAAGITYAVVALLMVCTGPERPLSALLAIVNHETAAPRPAEPTASGAVLRPLGIADLPSRAPGKAKGELQ